MKPSSFVQSGEFFTKLHRSVAFRVITMSHWKRHTKHDNGHYLLNSLVFNFHFRGVWLMGIMSHPRHLANVNRPFEPISGSVLTRVKWLTGVISPPPHCAHCLGWRHFLPPGFHSTNGRSRRECRRMGRKKSVKSQEVARPLSHPVSSMSSKILKGEGGQRVWIHALLCYAMLSL